MSQFFSLSRFGRLFSKHTAEQAGGYLMATVVLLGGIGLVLGFVAFMAGGRLSPDMQGVIFIMGLLAAGAFFTSTVFALFGDKRQATAALMLPASHWEKYLVGWLYAVPLFLAVYVGCFYLIDYVVLQVAGHSGGPVALVPLFSNQSKLYYSLPVYTVVSAVFLWGSIFFEKQHFVRTAFALLLGAVLVSLLNVQLVQALVGRSVSGGLPYGGMSFQEGKEWFSVNLSPIANGRFLVVPLGLLLLGWAAAYVRLKEKQI